jgi:formate/nitrite transporter FocA (FNT family)
MHKIVSAMIFPIGLTLIVLTGTNLFTGDIMFGWLPFVTRDERRTWKQKLCNLARLWAIVFTGNFIGSLILARFS